jgi:hydroxypyruvate isomerase
MALTPLLAPMAAFPAIAQAPLVRAPNKQRVMSSVWTGLNNSFEDKCKILASIGFKGMDLPQAAQVPMLKQYGLTPAMMTGPGTSFQQGLIRKELHDTMEGQLRQGIDQCAAAGCPNFIVLPRERRGMSREEGGDNAIAILSRVKGYAEEKGINVCMEITNSKVVADQRTDQVFDHLAWGINVCKKVQSPRVKIVYDFYHVQIADGGF